MRIYNFLNKTQTSALFSFILSGIFVFAAQMLNLINAYFDIEYDYAVYSFSSIILKLSAYSFCFFMTLFGVIGKRELKAFWSILCLALIDTAVKSFTDDNVTFFAGIIVSLFCVFCFKRFGFVTAMAISTAASLIFGILLGITYDYLLNALEMLAGIISEKGIISSVLFSLTDTFLSFFGIDSFSELFFYKSYGGSMYIDGKIVTGAVDLFSSGYNGNIISNFLSGHYYMMFSVIGMTLALLGELKDTQRLTLIVLTFSAVLSGNYSILLFYILLESPFLIISTLILSAVSFGAASVLDLQMGYIADGGIIEMIININKPIYLLTGGFVLIALGYFTFKFSIEKHGISDALNIYIPTRLNPTVDALGGIGNILRFKGDNLEVRNPKLVNTFSLNCEIKENIVSSDDENFIELKDYLGEKNGYY